MHKIHVELQDYVLDNLRGSRAALVNCALVCRAWGQRARFNLFHTIHINWDKRQRTDTLFEELLGTHSLVRELTLSSAAGMQPEDLVRLLDTLENLEVLSIHGPGRNRDLATLIRATNDHLVLGERLLVTIARMERLRVLSFGRPDIWGIDVRHDDGKALEVSGLRALRELEGNIFTTARMHRLWSGLAAAKAEGGATPLEYLGAKVIELQPVARFICDVGVQLESMWLDIRGISRITMSNFRGSGLTLGGCTRLRTLTLYLKAPSAFDNGHLGMCAALLSTATESVPLVHVRITVYHLLMFFFVLGNIPESVSALDQSIAGLPHLKRVDWNLAQCLPDSSRAPLVGEKSSRILFSESFPRLAAQTKRIEVTWRSSDFGADDVQAER